MPYVAVVRLLIDTESKAAACDVVYAILTEQMQSAVPTSRLLDWRYEYSGSPEIVPMKDGYTPDVSHFPEHPRIYAAER